MHSIASRDSQLSQRSYNQPASSLSPHYHRAGGVEDKGEEYNSGYPNLSDYVFGTEGTYEQRGESAGKGYSAPHTPHVPHTAHTDGVQTDNRDRQADRQDRQADRGSKKRLSKVDFINARSAEMRRPSSSSRGTSPTQYHSPFFPSYDAPSMTPGQFRREFSEDHPLAGGTGKNIPCA